MGARRANCLGRVDFLPGVFNEGVSSFPVSSQYVLHLEALPDMVDSPTLVSKNHTGGLEIAYLVNYDSPHHISANHFNGYHNYLQGLEHCLRQVMLCR